MNPIFRQTGIVAVPGLWGGRIRSELVGGVRSYQPGGTTLLRGPLALDRVLLAAVWLRPQPG
jgi:hypothetical protein